MNSESLGERVSFVALPKFILLALTEYTLKNVRQRGSLLKIDIKSGCSLLLFNEVIINAIRQQIKIRCNYWTKEN